MITSMRDIATRMTLAGLTCVGALWGLSHEPARAAAEVKWPPITAAEKSFSKIPQDPYADFVLLNNERQGKIFRRADDWVNVLNYHWRGKVLAESGRRFSEIRIRAGKYSRVTNIQARTIRPDGTIVSVDPSRIFEKITEFGGSLKISEWVFNFAAVEPGAILEYRYDRHDNYLAFIDPFYFEGNAFTVRAKFTQAIPDEMGYQILCSRCPPGTQPTLGKWREGKARGKLYELELNNLPGYKNEVLMPPRRDASPSLEMVLHTWANYISPALGRQDRWFVDWDSVAAWASHYYDAAAKEGQPELRNLVRSWTDGIADLDSRRDAVVRHVRNDFKFVPWTTVVGQARSMQTVVREMVADNEEKAVLLKAALKTLGIEADLALVSGKDSGDINPNFFSLSQFTHTIVGLRQPDGSLTWIDPTVSYAPAFFVPWKDAGAKALLLQGRKGSLIDLPAKQESSRTRYEIEVMVTGGSNAELKVEAEYSGEDAIDMRTRLAPVGSDSRTGYLVDWLNERVPGAQVSALEFDNLEDDSQPLTIKFNLSGAGVVTIADDVVLVRGCILSGIGSNPITSTNRRHPLQVDRGWNIQESVVVQAPEGMEIREFPPSTEVNANVARLSFSCRSTVEGGARCSRVFTAPRRQWPPNALANLMKLYDKMLEVDRTTLAFQAIPSVESGQE